MFSRDFRRPKAAKLKIYFNFEGCRASVVLLSSSFVVAVVVSTGGRWSGCRAPGVLRCVFRPFFPLSRFACGALHLNMALFRILRGFLAGFGVRMYICLAWVLCVACVAFVRVWS